jgi:hypothetical protein
VGVSLLAMASDLAQCINLFNDD